MKYSVRIFNSILHNEEIIEGNEINDVLNRAAYIIFFSDSNNNSLSESNKKRKWKDIKTELAKRHCIALDEKRHTWDNILKNNLDRKVDIWGIRERDISKSFTTLEPKLEITSANFATDNYEIINPKPCSKDAKYTVSKTLFNSFLPFIMRQRVVNLQLQFQKDLADWTKSKDEYEAQLIKQRNDFADYVEDITNTYTKNHDRWLAEKKIFDEIQHKELTFIKDMRRRAENAESDGLEYYYKELLKELDYPPFGKIEGSVFYNTNNAILAVDVFLPSIDDLHAAKEVRYVASKDTFEEKCYSISEFNILYDSIIYQLILKILNDLTTHSIGYKIESICINGFVKLIDKSNGKEIEPCILSLLVKKSDFMELDLTRVSPESCFKALKGRKASTFGSQTAIEPILYFNKLDKRFVDTKEVMNNINTSTNLAEMPWEDFEHLIREVFELEFSQNGGEVKVTQASRDGGVDAIAFDPDPIRGGKIVIQAKRYTNTVGVAAVRDLYGTVMNEGATKGILVTTSDFGADSYSFAKNKPITLLNGAHLLFLLEKHGKRARIEIRTLKK